MKKLTWDSAFWGIDIYDAQIGDSLKIDKSSNYIIQFLCNQNEVLEIEYKKQLKYIETKITLKKDVKDVNQVETDLFKELTISDLDIYKNDFYELFGRNSRYRMFPKNKVNEFYYVWLVNGINDVENTKVIGYYQNNKLAGFVSYKIFPDFIQIGLIGVFKEYQRKGISHKLLSIVENKVIDQKLKTLRIATNSFNQPALNTYIRKGFIIDEIKYWFYIYDFGYNKE